MGLLIFVLVLFVFLAVALVALGFRIKKVHGTSKGFFLIPFSALAFVFLLFGSFCKVGANEVGIIYNDQKGVLDTVKYEGFQTKSIFEHITTISTANKTAILQSAGQTSDSAYATFDLTIIYRIDKDNAGKFFKKASATDINQQQLASLVKESLQATTIKYDIYMLLGENLDNVRSEFTEYLTSALMERYHITLVSTSFDDIDAGDRIEEIIKNKAEALQQIEIAQAEQQKAQIEVETAKIKAEAEAAVVRIQAQAEADKVELEKTAIALMIDNVYKATKQDDGTYLLTYKQCAEIVLQQIYYEKWDGILPDYLGGDGANIILPSIQD